MQIGKVLYPITSLGPGVRTGIWVIGCLRNCGGCSNPELQASDPTGDIDVDTLYEGIARWGVDGVTISGGEPFMQVHDLRRLVERYRADGIEDILVFTGYTLEELRSRNDPDIECILSSIAVLVDGPFVRSKVPGTRLSGSSNQRVMILDRRFEERYKEYLSKGRTVDIGRFGDQTHFIGIPEEGYESTYVYLTTGGN